MTRAGSDDAPLERETVGALDVGGGSAQIVALMEHLDAGTDEVTAPGSERRAAADLDRARPAST